MDRRENLLNRMAISGSVKNPPGNLDQPDAHSSDNRPEDNHLNIAHVDLQQWMQNSESNNCALSEIGGKAKTDSPTVIGTRYNLRALQPPVHL